MFSKEFSLEVTSEIDWGLRRSRERRSLLQVHKPAKVLSELSAFLLDIVLISECGSFEVFKY